MKTTSERTELTIRNTLSCDEMGQSAQKKMKNKKRTNITANQDGKKETKQTSKPQNGHNANGGKLNVSKSDTECQTVEVESENQPAQKTKNANKAKIVVKAEDLGIVYTENLILKRGVKREELLQEKFGMQHLSVLATVGDVEKARAFFDSDVKRNPNERVECNGSTPLILAADNKHAEVVKLLLENGADCSLANHEGNNALMAAIKSGDADVINAIWPHRNSLNLDHANKNGYTALHFAADRKWECCAQFLLANGASPNCKTITGETPLMFAARHGDKKTAEKLLQAKADVLAEDSRGKTAICLALLGSKKGVLGYLLDKLPVEKSETFLKSRLYYLKHPFMEDYREFCDLYLFRLLLRLTWKPMLRDAFYNQKVIAVVLDRMREIQLQPQDMIQLSLLLCSIMFMFKKQADVKLIKQYIYNGGPDFTIDTVRYYTEKMNIMIKDSIIYYLPVIGITEAPEGVAWLKKNALRVSEYSNFFCGSIAERLRYATATTDVLTEIDPDFSKVLIPLWKTFHRILFEIQQKQREKTMLKLLQEEEREKERKVKKKEKRQQKRQLEKEKKAQKQDEPTDTSNQPTSSPVVEDATETIDISLNSNDNENESASRPDVKNGKKKKLKIRDEILNDVGDTLVDTSDRSLGTDFIEDQMLAYSSHPDKWKTVQTRRQIKVKDKVKDKLEMAETEKKEPVKERKCQNKFTKKGQEKWKQQRERFHAHPVCWADVAKGVSAAKTSEGCEAPDDANSGFSYEDEFPTLDGTKPQADITELKSDIKDTAHMYNSGNTSEDDLKEALTYNTESSGNPSSPSGFSLNSFSCDVEPCGTDEKYYSDDESLAYTQQPLPVDETNIGWEDMAKMNDIRCTTMAYSMPGHNTVTQMNSETLQYLVDAYIASDSNHEDGIKHNTAKSSQDVQEVTERNNGSVSTAEKKNTKPQDINTENGCASEGKKKTIQAHGATENQSYHEQSGLFGKPEHSSNETQRSRTDIQITREAYARDPSPTKAPRKRFVPQKNKTSLLSKKEQSIKDKKIQVSQTNLSVDVVENTINPDSNVPDTRGKVCNQILSSKQENNPFDSWQGEQKESKKNMTFAEDNEPCPEELPTWCTYVGPPREMDNLSDLNDRRTEALAKHHAPNKGMLETSIDIQKQLEIPVDPGFVKTDCAADDDIANDPCVVQYWTQPNTSSVKPGFQIQHQAHRRESTNVDLSANTGHRKEPNVGTAERQYYHSNRTNLTPKDIAPDKPMTGGSQPQRKTAIVKPISKQWNHARHSVNSALGQSILENAMRIDTTPDEVLYPSDLRGSPEPHEREDTEPDYFPSFHEDTRLSSDYNPDAISVFHRLQQIQLTQLKNYFDAFRGHLLNKMSVYQTDFHYYASCTGLTQQQINEHLGINHHQQHMDANVHVQQQHVPTVNTDMANPDRSSHPGEGHPEFDRQREMQRHSANEIHSPKRTAILDDPTTSSSHSKPNLAEITNQTVQRSAAVKSVQPHRHIAPDSHGINHSEYSTPTTGEQEERLNREEAKAARKMADRALQEIKEAYSAMIANAIKSRRWREKLLDIRHMSPSDINMIGNIVFPKVNQARYVIMSRPETIMLGFLLNGTPVAVRIVNWRSRHLARDDLQRLVDLDVSKYFMSKYRAFSFLNGNYYIAMDLYEYTLDEYLYKLKMDGQDSPLGTNKLIWQFLRGLNSIHQQCLMVHGEIRPSNIVLDASGNLRITGYGLGRRVTCNSDKISSEMSTEERCWLAPEILKQEQGDTFKADIWSAGMIMYFILSGGKQPFGADPRDVVWNLSRRHLRMESINEEAFHLLSTMISLNKAERPATSEALRHPYFWAEEKRLRFVLIAGSDVLRDLKAGIPMTGGPGDTMIDILNSVPSTSLSDWMSEIDHAVMKEMRTFRQYKNTVVEAVLFVYNCCLHFEKMSAKAREVIDEPCKYFLTRFPALFMTVYGAIKMSNRTEKTCYKPFF